MGEIMKWSKLKKRLEDFICPSLKGRVEFWITSYRKTHDQVGRAYITVDGKEVINMCTLKKEIAIYGEENELMSKKFLNSPIEESLKSNNPIIKSLALIDRRVGKRTLNMLKESMKNESELVRYFYNLRCESEGILNC